MCLPLVGSLMYGCHDQRNGLTTAGLLMEVADNPDRMRATSNELMDRLSLDRRGYRRSNSRTLITYLQVTRFLFSTDNAKLLAYAITDITREPVRDYGHGNLE